MGAPQATKERFVVPPGYTQIPNVLFDEVMPVASTAEWKVTCAIARQTFGWGREERLLSNAELCELTGLSRQSVTKGLEEGVERGFLGKRPAGSNKFLYGIRVKKVDSSTPLELPTSCTESFLDSRKPTRQEKESPTGGKHRRGRKGALFVPDLDSSLDSIIVECFESWRVGTGRNGTCELTVKRAESIRARLREAGRGADGGTEEEALAHAREEVLRAVKGMATSVWHKDNAQQEFDQLFRKRERIEFFVKRLARTEREEGESAAERFSIYDQAVAAQQGGHGGR